jgi:hypothetical protein
VKTIIKTYNIYEYTELSEKAKEKAQQWYLDDDLRPELFREYIEENLTQDFNNSNLKVSFSLGYCQGDGLNIEGNIKLYDFINVWDATEKEKRTMEKYIDYSLQTYTFEKNNHYCYSCKFIDKKYIDDTIEEFIEELKYQYFKNIKNDVINRFFNDLIDYFNALDRKYEKEGYKYFYEPDEEEIIECCTANEWYFDINGNFMEV